MSSRRIGRRGQRPRPRLATRRPAVEAMERRELLSVVTSNADAGAGTLRQAIMDANNNKGLDQITFNLPAGQTTIVVKSPLPVISDPVVIDGLTQPGSNGVPIVEVTGRVGTANGAGDGLEITSGGSTVRGLVINGFSGSGIYLLSGDNNTIQNNYIGTGVNGTDDVGNSRHGILIQASSNNVIGGGATTGNIIDYNGDPGTTFDGVAVVGAFPTAINNKILGNSIAFNADLGIDLGNDGVTANDPAPDNDAGPNLLQNFPVINSAQTIEDANGVQQTKISVSLTSKPNTTYVVELFADTSADDSGYGQGEKSLGVQRVTTDASGNASFALTLVGDLVVPAGSSVSATATDPSGNTSEFAQSQSIVFLSSRIDIAVTATAMPDPVQAGQVLTYTATITNRNRTEYSGPAVLRTILPDSVAFNPADFTVSVAGSSAPITVSGRTVTADFGVLGPNETATLTLPVRPSAAGILVTRFFAISGGVNDPNRQNDSASTVTQVTLSPDTPVLAFQARDFSVAESGKSALVTVTRSNAFGQTVTVDYSTADGTAVAGTNYVTQTGTLTFGPSDQVKTFEVQVLDNNHLDPNRTIQLNLTNPTGTAIVGVPNTSTLTIFDDDPATPPAQYLQFSAPTYTAQENGGQAVITVNRTGSTAGTVSIPFSTAPGTAQPNVDYTPVSGTLVFNDGEASKSFAVPLIDNKIVDGNRNFVVKLGDGVGAAPGAQSQANVTIVDDESPPGGYFQFSAADYTVSETDGTATITVTRNGGTGAVSIPYTTAPGTATPGVRYLATSGTLDFADGETSKTFTIPIFNDNIYEGTQTALLQIQAPANAALGTPSQATLTITDDETPPPSVVQFTASEVTVDESAGTANLTIQRTGPTDTAVSVGVGTAPGTATPGVDYTPVFQVVSFAPGETEKTVSIPIIDNTIIDGPRTLGVFLGSPSGPVVVGDVAATGIIIFNNDFDTVPPSVLATSLVPGIGGGAVGVTFAMSEAVDPVSASRTSNYSVVALGADGVFGTPDDRVIPVSLVGVDNNAHTIVVAFGVPVPDNQFVAVAMSGAPGGVTDLSGNLVDGDGNGTAGGFLIETLARGNRISYADADGDLVSLALAGLGGTLEVVRGPSGDASIVRVDNPVAGRTILLGSVARFRGQGYTTIGQLQGVSPFGRVVSTLRTPPFYIGQVMPNSPGLPVVSGVAAVRQRRG